jgi:hypothetical protein
MFPVSCHFGVTEKKRKIPYVCTSEGWYKFVEIANKKKVFAVIRMEDKGFVSVAEVKFRFQNAARSKTTHGALLPLFAYMHNHIKEWKEMSLR